jgi:hypothetical protein
MTLIAQSVDSSEALSAHIYDLLNSHFLLQALHVAAMLRIADLLADGPPSIDDPASATQTHGASLHPQRLCDASRAVGTAWSEIERASASVCRMTGGDRHAV